MSNDISEFREKCFDRLREKKGDQEAARICGVKAMTKRGARTSPDDVPEGAVLLLVRKEPLNVNRSVQAEIVKGNLLPVRADSETGKKIRKETKISGTPTPVVKTEDGFASAEQLEV